MKTFRKPPPLRLTGDWDVQARQILKWVQDHIRTDSQVAADLGIPYHQRATSTAKENVQQVQAADKTKLMNTIIDTATDQILISEIDRLMQRTQPPPPQDCNELLKVLGEQFGKSNLTTRMSTDAVITNALRHGLLGHVAYVTGLRTEATTHVPPYNFPSTHWKSLLLLPVTAEYKVAMETSDLQDTKLVEDVADDLRKLALLHGNNILDNNATGHPPLYTNTAQTTKPTMPHNDARTDAIAPRYNKHNDNTQLINLMKDVVKRVERIKDDQREQERRQERERRQDQRERERERDAKYQLPAYCALPPYRLNQECDVPPYLPRDVCDLPPYPSCELPTYHMKQVPGHLQGRSVDRQGLVQVRAHPYQKYPPHSTRQQKRDGRHEYELRQQQRN